MSKDMEYLPDNWTWSTSCCLIKLVKFRMHHHTVGNWPEIVYCRKHSMVEWQIYVKHKYTYVNTLNLYSCHKVICWVGVQNCWIIIISWNFRKHIGSGCINHNHLWFHWILMETSILGYKSPAHNRSRNPAKHKLNSTGHQSSLYDAIFAAWGR